jgi:hypothetical protein
LYFCFLWKNAIISVRGFAKVIRDKIKNQNIAQRAKRMARTAANADGGDRSQAKGARGSTQKRK